MKNELREVLNLLLTVYPFQVEPLDGEFFNPLEDYEGFYEVSNFGRIKSLHGEAKIVCPLLNGSYLAVGLHKKGIRTKAPIHRLVAQTFIPNPNHLPEVDHINGFRFNNHVSGLEWVSRSENQRRAMENRRGNYIDTSKIAFNKLRTVSYLNQLILTTKQLADFYECSATQMKQNFNNNKDKFIEGKHYFKLEGATLALFIKNLKVDLDYLQISVDDPFFGEHTEKIRSLYLWTKRGAARHAKMLTTEKAWEVFEMLEDAYFDKPSTSFEMPIREKYALTMEAARLMKDSDLKDKCLASLIDLILN